MITTEAVADIVSAPLGSLGTIRDVNNLGGFIIRSREEEIINSDTVFVSDSCKAAQDLFSIFPPVPPSPAYKQKAFR